MKDFMFVVDGHSIIFENSSLNLINGVREVYDVNLLESVNHFQGVCHFAHSEDCALGFDVDVKQAYSVVKTEGILCEFLNDECGLGIRVYKDSDLIFGFRSDLEYKLPQSEFGLGINFKNKNNLHYFSDDKTTVISDNLTNRIIKYVSEEIMEMHTFTKYYDFTNNGITFYLLLVDYVPHSLTIYSDTYSTGFGIFNFKY